jgi:hypothetical protein
VSAPAARIGLSLSSEENGPREFVRYGAAAADLGFGDVIVSDHFHPWNSERHLGPWRCGTG